MSPGAKFIEAVYGANLLAARSLVVWIAGSALAVKSLRFLLALFEQDLPPCFVEDYSYCVGQIEAAASGHHGYAQPVLLRKALQYINR